MMFTKKSCILFFLMTISCQIAAQQVADLDFQFIVNKPQYTHKNGPIVTIDQAHFNIHTLYGRYETFGMVLQNDGYNTRAGKLKFTKEYLDSIKILVIANALADTLNDTLPARSAFSRDEIATLKTWVANGGRLFLIADHMPCAGAVSKLARNFGFNIINGYAFRIDEKPEIFSRKAGNLFASPIANGRNKAERVDSVQLFTGHAFLAPPEAISLMTLKDDYEILLPIKAGEFNDATPGFYGTYFVNGAMLKFGKGRMVLIAEAAMFSAQLQGPEKLKMGMNQKGAEQNPQFLLNIIHWLDGLF
jgi:hypothetical protein